MSGHTPGPWYADGLAIQAGPNNNIAVVNLARASQADADLIAAAPDLAAVLREVADFWAAGDAPQALTDKINAALAKAGL